MQSMASSPFYLLLVASLNFLSSDTKPISILDNGKIQCFFIELFQNDYLRFPDLLDHLKNRLMQCAIV